MDALECRAADTRWEKISPRRGKFMSLTSSNHILKKKIQNCPATRNHFPYSFAKFLSQFDLTKKPKLSEGYFG